MGEDWRDKSNPHQEVMIIPAPMGGNWGLGPSLLYLFGVLGALIWFEIGMRRHRPASPEEIERRLLAEKEAAKQARFTALLIADAKSRKAPTSH